MGRWRLILAISGVLLGLYGVGRLVLTVPVSSLMLLAVWLVAALIIHDGILSPVVVSVGWALRRFVPDRGRRYLQAGLIMAGLVTVIAIPMIMREGSQPPSKALLVQDYGGNLTLLLGIIGAATLIAYAARVARDHGTDHGGTGDAAR